MYMYKVGCHNGIRSLAIIIIIASLASSLIVLCIIIITVGHLYYVYCAWINAWEWDGWLQCIHACMVINVRWIVLYQEINDLEIQYLHQ